MLEKLKKHITSKGNTVDHFLKKKYPSGEWILEGDFYTYQAIVAHLTVKSIWKKDGQRIIAVNGRAIELTPDLDDKTHELEERRKAVPKENLRIYNFICSRFEEHGNEELSFNEANKEFGLDVKTIEAIYYRVDDLLYKKNN